MVRLRRESQGQLVEAIAFLVSVNVRGNLILERWIFLAMTLKETTVNQILNAYAKIRQELQESGRITGKNFNRLKFIDSCIAGKQETIQEIWGNTFVDVYALLDMPTIHSMLTKEKLNDQKTKEQIREKERIQKKAIQEKIELKEYMRNYILQEEPKNRQNLFAKATASSILKSYNKFFKSYKEGDVISNVNVFRLRAISNRLNHKKQQVKERYGKMFDRIYEFIERPEIASILLDEKIVIKTKSHNISDSKKSSNFEEKIDNEELDKNTYQDNKLSLLNTNLSQTEVLSQENFDEYTDWLDHSTSEFMATIIKPLLENDLEKESLESSANTLNKNTPTKSKNKSSTPNSPIKNLEEIALNRKNIESKLDFNPENLTDARKRINTAIVQRQGQSKFRSELLKAYGGQCAITDCDAEAALEAAHIFPYLGTDTNHVTNGLLFRADIHTLFDLYLISIDPDTSEVVVSSSLLNTCYKELNGKPLKSPQDYAASPSLQALARHYETFLLKQNK